jgi:hypothetical protein
MLRTVGTHVSVVAFKRLDERVFLHHPLCGGRRGWFSTKEFIGKRDAAYGYVPDDVAALACDSGAIILEAIKTASLTRTLQVLSTS